MSMASFGEKVRKVLCCERDPKYPVPYQFNFNGGDITPENQNLFETNFVRTSKYSPLSFLPSTIINQSRGSIPAVQKARECVLSNNCHIAKYSRDKPVGPYYSLGSLNLRDRCLHEQRR